MNEVANKDSLKLFLTNPIFLACLCSWIIAQFIKTIINLIYGKLHSTSEVLENLFWRTGGMPSSHSALVASLCTTIGFKSGFSSDVFMLSLAFFFVTIRDAFGVRRSSGIQSNKLNNIGKQLKEKNVIDDYHPLKEVNGHTPMQVILGVCLGVIVGFAFSFLK